MPQINYRYTITYDNGRMRSQGNNRLSVINISDEDYLKIVAGISYGKSLMEIDGIESVLKAMRDIVIDCDNYENLNGTYRTKRLKTPRKIKSIELYLDEGIIHHIRSLADPVAEMTRPEQTMTVYRADGSSVEIHYKYGKISYRDSRKKGQICSMTADTFLNWVVR